MFAFGFVAGALGRCLRWRLFMRVYGRAKAETPMANAMVLATLVLALLCGLAIILWWLEVQ